MNLLGSGIWGVGFAVVTARQKKLLKRFMATPMRKSHYLLGFILSRLVFLVVEVAALVGFGWLIFGVGVHGSFVALAAIALLGSLSFSGLGLLIASRARTVEGVSGLMNLAMLPMWILSGTFFSYSRFPDVMLPFVKALPLTALNDSLRAVMIDGASIFHLGPALAIVASWGLGLFRSGPEDLQVEIGRRDEGGVEVEELESPLLGLRRAPPPRHAPAIRLSIVTTFRRNPPAAANTASRNAAAS